MTAIALLATQTALHAQIQTRSIELGYDPKKVEPIYDGVVDAADYLAAKPKVMWILKEPYDGLRCRRKTARRWLDDVQGF